LKPVAKVTDRKTAVRRLWTAIQVLDPPNGEDPPYPNPSPPAQLANGGGRPQRSWSCFAGRRAPRRRRLGPLSIGNATAFAVSSREPWASGCA
jgi:hypothetical protein